VVGGVVAGCDAVDTGTMIAVAVAVLLGIGAVVVAARGTFSPRRPAFAGSPGRSEMSSGPSPQDPPPTLPLAAAEVIDLPVRGVRDAGITPREQPAGPPPDRLDAVVAEITPDLDERLRSIEERLAAMERGLAARIDDLARASAEASQAAAASRAALEASQAAAIDRLRADVSQALARPQLPPDRRLRERRAEVAADL